MVLASAVPHRRLQHPSVIIRVHQRLRRRRWRRQRRRLFHAGNTAVRKRGRPRKRSLSTTNSSTTTSSSTYNASTACSARRRRRRQRVCRRRSDVRCRRRDPWQRQTRTWTDATAVGEARAQIERRIFRTLLRQSFARIALPRTPLSTSFLRFFPRVRWRQAFLKKNFLFIYFLFVCLFVDLFLYLSDLFELLWTFKSRGKLCWENCGFYYF